MSRSPTGQDSTTPGSDYLDSWAQLAERIHRGSSFSGRERNCAFLNTGRGDFADVSGALGLDLIDDGRAIAMTDHDFDGDQDFWIAGRTSPRLRFLRNDFAPPGAALVLRLEGDPAARTNRDAIGARVVVELDDGRLRHQTVYAGDGFLSQSSTWLHFGLAGGDRVSRVTVRWPDQAGTRQEFTGLERGRRYRLKQGQSTAIDLGALGTRKVTGHHAEIRRVPTGEAARIRFSSRPPLPAVSHRDSSGQPGVITTGGSPLLINLWASHCRPCLVELTELSGARDRLARTGLKVLLLSVDDLEGADRAARQTALDRLEQLGVKIPTHFARNETIEELQAPLRQSIYRHRQLPVPTSFLVDASGKLALVVKGKVSVESLLAEVASLPRTEPALSLPFEGSFSSEHFETHALAVARAYLEGQYPEDAREYLRKFITEHPAPPAGDSSPAARQTRLQLADVHNLLGSLAYHSGEYPAAVEHFRSATSHNPGLLLAHIGLGESLISAGEPDPALDQLEKTWKLRPGFPPTASALAWVLATHPSAERRDGTRARQLAELACKSSRFQKPEPLDALAAAHAELGQFEEAIRRARQALEAARRLKLQDRARVIEERIGAYESGQAHRMSP